MKINDIITQLGEECFDHSALGSAIGEKVADRIREKSGFETRFLTGKNSDIFTIANSLIELENLSGRLSSCDFIIVVSEYVVKLIPPPSAFLLSNVKLDNTLVIDLNRGCSGFCEALVIANSFFSSGTATGGCIVTAENYSKIIKKSNRTLSPIFSDAVTFTFLSSDVENKFSWNSGSFYSFKEDLIYDIDQGELFMNGAGLVSFVKSEVIPQIKLLLKDSENNVFLDYFFVHQGSALIVDAINNSLPNFPAKAEFLSADLGNTNSSSIPISIKKTLIDKNLNGNFKCLLSGFGVGLSFCNVIMDLEI